MNFTPQYDTYKCSRTKELNWCGIFDSVCVMSDNRTAPVISGLASSNNSPSAISTGYKAKFKPVSDLVLNLSERKRSVWRFLSSINFTLYAKSFFFHKVRRLLILSCLIQGRFIYFLLEMHTLIKLVYFRSQITKYDRIIIRRVCKYVYAS
jgi:hypothetical protein